MANFCKCDTFKRNLVVCIDGTTNQFGVKNTNVIELYGRLINDENQLIYYNSGIGSYAGRDGPLKKALKAVPRKVEAMVAGKISKIVQGAYRWLAENYQGGDRIYLFGFSRGAYAIRILAAMIQKVGLIYKGNEEQIPFAYAVYEDPNTDKVLRNAPNSVSRTILRNNNTEKISMSSAQVFKETFSRNVAVHFVGVWDTVSSIGFVRRDSYPGIDNPLTSCYFRHALALDERHVKFLPEYACGGHGMAGSSGDLPDGRVKEVWFRGSHSDIGGGNIENLSLDNGPAPLVWMVMEAYAKGVRFDASKVGQWNTFSKVRESMNWKWRLLEYVPVKRRSYADKDSTARLPLHRSQGRPMQHGQRIHISVALLSHDDKLPWSTLPENVGFTWQQFVDMGSLENRWQTIIEIDALAVKFLVVKIADGEEVQRCLKLLVTMTNLQTGLNQFRNNPAAVLTLYNMVTEEREGSDVIQRALDRIGNINDSALDRQDVMSEMKNEISRVNMHSPGLEVVVVFLYHYNLMRLPLVEMIYEDILSYLGQTTYKCESLKILTIAARDGDDSLRCQIAEEISTLLQASRSWEDGFDVFDELLDVLGSHAESRRIAFQDLPSLFKLFMELVSSLEEVQSRACENCIKIFGVMCSYKEGRRLLIDEGRRSCVYMDTRIEKERREFVDMSSSGLLMYLLLVLEHGSIAAALRCFWLFERLVAADYTRTYSGITDDHFQDKLFSVVMKRNNMRITAKFFTFIRDTISPYVPHYQGSVVPYHPPTSTHP